MLTRPLVACLSAGIVGWVKKKTGPATLMVDTEKMLTETEEANEVLVVGYFKALKVPAHV